jgi:hypothetical protein
MEKDVVKEEICCLITNELILARKKFSPFNSPHEGYAVILEEVEELNDDLEDVFKYLNSLWNNIKNNDINEQGLYISQMQSKLPALIYEAIQVAAMVESYNNDIINKKQ